MQRILVIPFMVLIFLTSFIFGRTFYSTDCDKWKPYHDTVKGEIKCKDNVEVIRFKGDGLNSGYILGAWEGLDGAWNDREAKVIEWDMNYKESYIVYIRIMTKDGARYLYYTARDEDLGKVNSTMIHHGLGSDTIDGVWHENQFTRDLEEDLQDFEPDNELVAVNAFLIYGSGMINTILTDSFFKYLKVSHSTDFSVDISLVENDYQSLSIEYGLDENYGTKIKMRDETNSIAFEHHQSINIKNLKPNSTYHFRIVSDDRVSKDYTFKTLSSNRIVYEDAQDGDIDGWRTKTDTSLVENISMGEGNRAIGFLGRIVLGGFKNNANAWHDTTHDIISWDIKTYGVNGGGFVVYVRVMTKNGARYLYYTPIDKNRGINNSIKGIHHGLGSDVLNDKWHTFTRDLRADLKDYEPNNELLEVNGFFLTNTNSQFIFVDNIEMYNRENSNYAEYLDINKMEPHTYSASIIIDKGKVPVEKILLSYSSNSRYNIYPPEPNMKGKEVAVMGRDKIKYLFNNLYSDIKYYYRIFYKDGSMSKERTFTTLTPKITYYGETESHSWRIYGRDKSRGTITYGDYFASFNGEGLNTGYILGGLENDSKARAWNNTEGNRVSLIFTGAPFMIYVRVMTKDGARFLCYHSNPKRLGIDTKNSSYIHYETAITSGRGDSEEPTVVLDIKDDLKLYEPNNELVSINSVIVYGNSTVYGAVEVEDVKK